jgi:hypothetical protein
MDYPGLYEIANKKSESSQKKYFFFLRLEYSLLITSAVNAVIDYKSKYILSFFLFCALLLIIYAKKKFKHDQEWYKYRAIAESIKTITWKFAMKSEPFNDTDEIKNVKELSKYLDAILKGSEYISKSIDPKKTPQFFLTSTMKMVRELNYKERIDFYCKHRIEEQGDWYAKKSVYNKKWSTSWFYAISAIYTVAIIFSGYNAFFSDGNGIILPITVLSTIASSLVGWAQVKRYNELAASYILTAHEINLIKEQSYYIKSEADLVDFVKDSEVAFSREHTQWVARRTTK